MSIDWDVQLQRDMDYAAKQLMDTGSFSPMFAIHTYDEKVVLVATPFGSEQEREMTHMVIKLMCVAHDASGFSFMGEAWVRWMDRQEGESVTAMNKRAYEVRPSQATDRKEVVTVTLVYRDETNQRKVRGRMSEIIRDADGKITGLTPMEMPDGVDSRGAVPDILPRRRPSPAERAVAEAMRKRYAGDSK